MAGSPELRVRTGLDPSLGKLTDRRLRGCAASTSPSSSAMRARRASASARRARHSSACCAVVAAACAACRSLASRCSRPAARSLPSSAVTLSLSTVASRWALLMAAVCVRSSARRSLRTLSTSSACFLRSAEAFRFSLLICASHLDINSLCCEISSRCFCFSASNAAVCDVPSCARDAACCASATAPLAWCVLFCFSIAVRTCAVSVCSRSSASCLPAPCHKTHQSPEHHGPNKAPDQFLHAYLKFLDLRSKLVLALYVFRHFSIPCLQDRFASKVPIVSLLQISSQHCSRSLSNCTVCSQTTRRRDSISISILDCTCAACSTSF
eukprot:m.464420 g.464420  ORF g.464420 m.464420 type:complete len:325 (-) comp21618_c0_seq8:498-1472(-)